MNENQNSEAYSENDNLEILANAISDVGYWTWWADELPDLVQIELGGTQLYFPPKDSSQVPNSQIALQFINPKSVSFITKHKCKHEWFNDLHNDEVEPPACDDDRFTFTDNELMTEIIGEAKSIKTIHGYSPTDKKFLSEKYKLTFWAGDYGFAVSADEVKLLAKDEDVSLDQITNVYSKWCDYWEKYWKLRGTENALPEDYACEVTIPLKN